MRRRARVLFGGRASGGGITPVSYLLDDQFTTPDPAPITDPRTAEPSPGNWDVTQTGDTIAVTSSGLEITGADAFRGVVSQETFAIGSGGVGLFSRQSANGNRNYSGFGNSLSNGAGGGIQLDTTYVYRITGPGVSISSILTGLTEGTIYDIWVIRDDAGHVCWVFDGKLIWASAGVNTDTLKINHANYHASATGKYSATKVIDLPTSGYTEWSTQYGIATDHVASPSEGATFTQTPNALVDLTIDALPTNLLSNPGFETAGGGGADVFADWAETAQAGSSLSDETTEVRSGSHSIKMDCGVDSLSGVSQQPSLSANRVTAVSLWGKSDTANGIVPLVRFYPSFSAAPNPPKIGVSGTFLQTSSLSISPTGNTALSFSFSGSYSPACVGYCDDTSLSEPVVLDIRRTDDDNKWHLVVDSNGRPVLYERISGTDTARISGADGDVTAGDRVRVICDWNDPDDDWSLWVEKTSIGTYQGATNGLETKTSGELAQVGSGAAVSDLVAYPRDVSGILPSL